MKHAHHNHCEHDVKYCAKCDVAYCNRCGKEYRANTYTWYSYPTNTTGTGTGTVWGGQTSDATITYTGTHAEHS